MLESFFDQYATNFAYSKNDGGWCYEDGCLYRGLLELYLATGDTRWRTHLYRLIGPQVNADGSLRGYSVSENNIDNILSGRLLFHMEETGDPRYAKAADLLVSQLVQHPRTSTGNYWHKQIYPNQIWLDGLYMGLPFQIEYGLTRHQAWLVDDALDQLDRAVELMRDKVSGLYYHGYDDSRAKAWSDPETGLSKSFWGRAVGWLAMALVDMLALLPADHPRRSAVAGYTLDLATSIMEHRTPNGLWLQVVDRPDLPGNYEEISGSAMLAYFLLRSALLLPGNQYLGEAGSAALDAICQHHVTCNSDGIWELRNICEVAGLGQYRDRERDGTPEYYTTEKIVSNDVKGVGPLMMAEAMRLRYADSASATTRDAASR